MANILLDCTGMRDEDTGMSLYTRRLVEALAASDTPHRFTAILNPLVRHADLPHGVTEFPVRVPHLGLEREYFFWARRKWIQTGWDLFHCLTEKWPSALRGGVCTVHDLRFAEPEAFGGISGRARRLAFRRRVYRAVSYSNAVICISEATASAIRDYFPRATARISIIYHGPPGFPRQDSAGSSPLGKHFLTVAEDRPHKNLRRVVRAFERARALSGAPNDFPPIVMVGALRNQALRALARSVEGVEVTGYVPRSELLKLYDEAVALVFVPLVEGFGFPLLEAMERKCPIVCSDRSAVAEVAGDAGILVNPFDEEEIAQALVTLVRHPQARPDLIRRGSGRLQSFSWAKAARQVLRLYDGHCSDGS